MRIKILTLGLVYLLLIFLPCCKETPTSPETELAVKAHIYFTASPSAINLGESSTLSWSVRYSSTITIDNGIGEVSADGSKTVNPTETTTYTLTASNYAGQVSQSVTVEVKKDGNLRSYLDSVSSSFYSEFSPWWL